MISHHDIGPLQVGLFCWGGLIGFYDWRHRRIPNWGLVLVLVPALLALIANRTGLLGAGWQDSLLGAGLGLLLFLPGYVIGASGAGDAKLAMVCGLLLGDSAMLHAIMITAILLVLFAAVFVYRFGWTRARKMRFPAGFAIVTGFGAVLFLPGLFP